MATLSMPPWITAAGGLGQGLTQGLLTGVELQERKRQSQQAQFAEALSLLQTGTKAGDKGIQQAALGMLQQIAPNVPWANVKIQDALEQARQEVKNRQQLAGEMVDLTPQQKSEFALTGTLKHEEPWKQQYAYDKLQAQIENQQRTQEYRNRMADLRDALGWAGIGVRERGLEQRGEQFQQRQTGGGTTREAPLTASDLEVFKGLETELNQAKTPQERAIVEKKIKARGGSTEEISTPPTDLGPFGKWGGSKKTVVIPPETKQTVTSKAPWQGGAKPAQGGGDAAYEGFKKAYAKNPEAAIARSKQRGDGFAERYLKEQGK